MRHISSITLIASCSIFVVSLALSGCGSDDCTQTLTCKRTSTGDGGENAGGGPMGGAGVGAGAGATGGGGGSSLLANGEACSGGAVGDAACQSGICADEVCCASACDGTCESCALAGTEGTCTPHALGDDPESECGNTSTCNGQSACGGDHIWSLSLGDDQDDEVRDVAIDSQGNSIVCGRFRGTMQVGTTTLSAPGTVPNVFMIKLDPSGAVVWAHEFGDGGTEGCTAIGVGPNDEITMAGTFTSTINFGGSTLSAPTNQDIYVARFSSAAAHIWSDNYVVSSGASIDAAAINTAGDIFLLGYITNDGSVNFGGGTLSSAGDFDMFLAKLNANGSFGWHKRFGDATFNYSESGDVTVDSSGNVIIVGVDSGNNNFGGGVSGNRGVFVVKYSANGTYLFGDTFNAVSGSNYAHAVATDSTGNIFVGGEATGSTTFGGSLLGVGAYVAKLSPTLAHLWSQSLKGNGAAPTERAKVWALASTADGGVAGGGEFEGALEIGGVEHDTAGGNDAFLFRFAADGARLWSAGYGDNSEQRTRSVAVGDQGVVAGGFFAGSVNFGGGPLSQNGAEDGFVTVLTP